MRYQSSVTSLSWIPSEAIPGAARMAFDAGVTHYDRPPPDRITDLEALQAADRFRFANVLTGWIDTDDAGRITGSGHTGRSLIGSTTVRLGSLTREFQPAQLPGIASPPERGDRWVRFTHTSGGRTGLPAPRRVRRPPYVQWQAPLVWTTLSLTLHADGQVQAQLTGASRFPRHWVYGHDGQLTSKSGLTDFREWWLTSFGRHSPWGDEDSPALVTAVETALERELSHKLMHGAGQPRFRQLSAGEILIRQGEAGSDIFLILDGVIRVDRDGAQLAEYGPGAMLGERACLEGGTRTATLTAVTACRVASVRAGQLDRAALAELSGGHRREDTGPA